MRASRGVALAEVAALALMCAMIATPAASESIWEQERLSGDWGGLRGSLAERGVTLELVDTSDVMAVVSGGVDRGSEYLTDLDLMLTLETEPLLGWKGGTVFLYGIGLMSSGSPSENAGDTQTLDNIDAPEEWRLYEAWIQQELLDGRMSLLAGLYDVAGEFDVVESASLFLNSSFGTGKDLSQSGRNGPSIFPVTSLGVRLEARPIPEAYLRLAVLDGVPGDPDDSRSGKGYLSLRSDDGLFAIAELGGVTGGAAEGDTPDTKLACGGWYYSAKSDRTRGFEDDGDPRQRRGNFGVYLLGERQIYREPGAPERGLSLLARVGYADPGLNEVGAYVGGGAVYTGLFRERPEDRLGLGVAAAFAGHEFERASEADGSAVKDAEVAIELRHRMQLAPWLSVQPDLQYIVNPGFDAHLDDALVLGARAELAF